MKTEDPTAPWESSRGCFGHCDKEGWYSECVSKANPQEVAALNAYYADYMIGPNKSLSEVRPPRTVHDMRAALRAAYETKGERR